MLQSLVLLSALLVGEPRAITYEIKQWYPYDAPHTWRSATMPEICEGGVLKFIDENGKLVWISGTWVVTDPLTVRQRRAAQDYDSSDVIIPAGD